MTAALPFCLRVPVQTNNKGGWNELCTFAFDLVDCLRPRSVVEIGVGYGGSFGIWAQALADLNLLGQSSIMGVDRWGPTPAGGANYNTGPEAKSVCEEFLVGQGWRDRCRLISAEFDAALTLVADGTVDILHRDGPGEEGFVQHDVDAWLPKLSRTGVFCLHDSDETTLTTRYMRTVIDPAHTFVFTHGSGLLVACPNSVHASLAWLFSPVRALDIREFFSGAGRAAALDRVLVKLPELRQQYARIHSQERQ